jgi:sugar fermentation stimulation protein A
MKYKKVVKGKFISRPNRFIAQVEIDGKVEICHVKNTGRCKELLVPGVTIYLEQSDNPTRSTKYDLVAVEKGTALINMDSQAPNKVIYEWIKSGVLFKNITLFKPETVYGDSRFDLYLEADGERIFAEVKGVTLENDGIAMFPDAPTERGVKHITELVKAVQKGYKSYIFFVIQMDECRYFTPNIATHPQFATALKAAAEQGVNIIALNCHVEPDSLVIKDYVEVKL